MGRLPKGELPLAEQIQIVKEIEVLETELNNSVVPTKHHKDLGFLIETNPSAYKDLVDRLSAGQSINKISRETGFESGLIRSVIKVHPDSINARREAIVERLEEAILATAERISEDNDKISINRLAEFLTETTKNFQLLRGEATSRTESKAVATPEDLQRMFDSLPKAKVTDDQSGKDS